MALMTWQLLRQQKLAWLSVLAMHLQLRA